MVYLYSYNISYSFQAHLIDNIYEMVEIFRVGTIARYA